jgi:hypothetical protein
MIATRTSGSSFIIWQAAMISRVICRLKALSASGRFSVRKAMLSSTR